MHKKTKRNYLPHKILAVAFSTVLFFNCATYKETIQDPKYLLEQEMRKEGYDRKSIDEHIDDTVLIFLGWKAKINTFGRLYSNFNDQHKIIYRLPDILISSDLYEIFEASNFIKNKVNKDLENYNIKTVYGISLGVVPALYTANHSNSIDKVILALPADDISEIIWKSLITRHIKRKAERKGLTKEDYDITLNRYDPINNLDNLQGKEIKVFIAKGDKITPYENAMNLINEMKKLDLDVQVKEVPILGHLLGGIYSSCHPDWY